MTDRFSTENATKVIGADEVDGIPVAVGQHTRFGFFQLIPVDAEGHATATAKYEPSLNNRIKYVEEWGWCEPWPAIPCNTLDRR